MTQDDNPMICEFCGVTLKYRNRRPDYKTTHINIEQKPQRHYFCSMECKRDWCHFVQKHNAFPIIAIELIRGATTERIVISKKMPIQKALKGVVIRGRN